MPLGVGRFRVNMYMDTDGPAIAFVVFLRKSQRLRSWFSRKLCVVLSVKLRV